MKKLFYLFALSVLSFTSCTKELDVEKTIANDKQSIFLKYGNYTWFETQVLLKDYLDEECDGSIESISSVYQIVNGDSASVDVTVIESTYTKEEHSEVVEEGFWLEDSPLNDEPIKVTFKEAFNKLMATNYPKPHSKYCVIRKQLGPKDANVQYIFGNKQSQLYVDAVNGNVSNVNPAFGY